MGLGKTVQVISFFAYMYEMKVRGPYLIVTPLSTLGNWIAELKRFTPSIPIVLYHGTSAVRPALTALRVTPLQYPPYRYLLCR
jgi:ATP-dependent DNA helicase